MENPFDKADENLEFSVLMSVYKNSKPDEIYECLHSLYTQTIPSDDIVVVLDGPVSKETETLLLQEKEKHSEITLYRIEKNVGLGCALQFGLRICKHELVARMDTDDIAVSNRFEKQLRRFQDAPALSIVGSDIAEFIGDKENIAFVREVPDTHAEICRFLKSRNPFNHMTVIFRKSEVERAGGYIDCPYNEDLFLWVRMYLAGCLFANIKESLVLARIDDDTFKRRGGLECYKSSIVILKFMKAHKIIGAGKYLREKLIRLVAYILMPNWLRAWAFKTFMRKKAEEIGNGDKRKCAKN